MNNPIKILYLFDHYPTLYQEYLATLLHQIKRQLDVKVLTYTNNEKADYNVISYGFSDKLQRVKHKLQLSKYPSLDVKIMDRFDIIHLQHSYLFPKLQPFFKEGIKKPKIIITLRGADTYIKPWVNEKWKELYKTNAQFIDAFVTVSQHQKEYLQKWGVSKEKIYVIPVSFGNKFNAIPKKTNKKKIKIVSAFRMCWEKNINGNLLLIRKLKEKGIPLQYDVFGDGHDKGQLLYLIDKYNLTNEVSYKGKIENKAFVEQLDIYDFYLQLSHSESLGMSVIEAQTRGLPVIVSNEGGLPEIVLHNQTGFLVDTHRIEQAMDYIIELWNSPGKYTQFSTQAIAHAQESFNVNRECDNLTHLYQTLVNK